jgi:hypothetical protein
MLKAEVDMAPGELESRAAMKRSKRRADFARPGKMLADSGLSQCRRARAHSDLDPSPGQSLPFRARFPGDQTRHGI